MLLKLMAVFAGMLLGNFAYQAFTGHDWGKALEISYFQAIALIAVYIVNLY